MIHDYTRKHGIVHSEILLPPNAPPDFQDRGTLWNSVEQIEKACNSQLARELEVALPIELSREEQLRLVREYCSSQFVSKGMCADFNIHDTGSGNPHAHILLTMRPMDEQGKWLPKSKKEYVLDENGERIRLASGRYKTRKVDLVDWNSHDNAEVWRKAWADLANSFLEQSNRPERIDHRSYERQGIEQIPTVHIGVAASQMEKKGIVTERGELNRSIKAANRMLREIRAQIGKLKEWLSEIFKAKEALRAEPQQPKSPDLSTLLFRHLDIQKAKGRKYSQSWQQQHTADELKSISKAVNLLAEKGIFTLEEFENVKNSTVKPTERFREEGVGREPFSKGVSSDILKCSSCRNGFGKKLSALFHGRKSSVGRVDPSQVIVMDVSVNHALYLIRRHFCRIHLVQLFLLQCSEKALHSRVVVTSARAAHALYRSVFFQAFAEHRACVLASPVAVQDHAARSRLFTCVLKCGAA